MNDLMPIAGKYSLFVIFSVAFWILFQQSLNDLIWLIKPVQ